MCLKVSYTRSTAPMWHLTIVIAICPYSLLRVMVCYLYHRNRNSVYRKTDQLDILGVYIILGVQDRAFKEAFKFIFASISTKQIWFRRKHQESLLIIVEYPVNQLLIYLYGLPSKEIHIRCFKSQLRCQNTRSRSLCSHR